MGRLALEVRELDLRQLLPVGLVRLVVLLVLVVEVGGTTVLRALAAVAAVVAVIAAATTATATAAVVAVAAAASATASAAFTALALRLGLAPVVALGGIALVRALVGACIATGIATACRRSGCCCSGRGRGDRRRCRRCNRGGHRRCRRCRCGRACGCTFFLARLGARGLARRGGALVGVAVLVIGFQRKSSPVAGGRKWGGVAEGGAVRPDGGQKISPCEAHGKAIRHGVQRPGRAMVQQRRRRLRAGRSRWT